mmetsp:Transcript_19650/g.65007  ORF Transcript_19650/g.65007 Transcript_19650/m.65007 type:complete len:213 (-) Transcript_19650:451-1089(-)
MLSRSSDRDPWQVARGSSCACDYLGRWCHTLPDAEVCPRDSLFVIEFTFAGDVTHTNRPPRPAYIVHAIPSAARRGALATLALRTPRHNTRTRAVRRAACEGSRRPSVALRARVHAGGTSAGTFMRSETGASLEGSSPEPLARAGSAPASISARAMSHRLKMQARCSGRLPCRSAWFGSALFARSSWHRKASPCLMPSRRASCGSVGTAAAN